MCVDIVNYKVKVVFDTKFCFYNTKGVRYTPMYSEEQMLKEKTLPYIHDNSELKSITGYFLINPFSFIESKCYKTAKEARKQCLADNVYYWMEDNSLEDEGLLYVIEKHPEVVEAIGKELAEIGNLDT